MPLEHSFQVVAETKFAIAPNEIRDALNKLAGSEAFGKAERPARFLRHLVETALGGQPSILKESVLGTDVFERPASWDPRLDPIVRQEAARLRKRITRYYETAGQADPIRIELPVGSYVPQFRRTAEGLPAAEPAPVRAPRNGWYYVLAATVACLALAAALLPWRSARHESAISIAVLPFTNMTADPADQYFSDGVTDEVADSLVRLKTVRILPRSATSAFKAEPRNPEPHDLQNIGRQLNASHILEATVERSGDRVNIVASLVRTSDGVRLWSNTYRRTTADISDIEGNLAGAVSATLGIAAPAPQKKHVPLAEAHDYFLRARFEASQGTAESGLQAQANFRRAIGIDSGYALAYAGLAAAIWNQNIWAGQSPLLEERRKSEELWQKALQIDPNYMAAHSGLAAYAMQYDWDWKRAEREYQAALSSGDNPGIEDNYAVLCLIQGRRPEADRHIERARQIDPSSVPRIANRVNFLQLAGRLGEAREECQRWVSRNDKLIEPKLVLNTIIASQGETGLAVKNLLALPQDQGRVQMTLAQVRARSGKPQEVARILAPLEQNYRDGRLFLYDFAIAYAEMGDAANAAKWMERSMDAREGPAMYIRIDPALAKVQGNAAFRAFKKRMDLDW